MDPRRLGEVDRTGVFAPNAKMSAIT